MISKKPLLFKTIQGKKGTKVDITKFKIEDYQEKIDTMKKICLESKGIGLASVQIGLTEHLFIAKRDSSKEFEVFFNAEIIESSEENIITTEGCLSIPKVFLPIKRHKQITIKWFDGFEERSEKLNEDFSIVVQHELSHLEGKTLFDLTTLNRQQKRDLLKRF